VHSFYTVPEYEVWKEENNGGSGWHIKYYKGTVLVIITTTIHCTVV
jgi:Toprim domain-containing protein